MTMTELTRHGPENLAGMVWQKNGQCALSGDLLRLDSQLDAMYRRWAAACRAIEYRVPIFISASDLSRLDYFRSFPHAATFPVTLDAAESNLASFADSQADGSTDIVQLAKIAPVQDVLTPAACYHFYGILRGRDLDEPAFLTTRATCVRREYSYAPLQRQWAFSMREIVCVGTEAEVTSFLEAEQARVSAFVDRIGLPVDLKRADDPFFKPARRQRVPTERPAPVKTEVVFRDCLPLASVNFHRDYIGEAFGISRHGETAFSGCVAFGIERWIYAFVMHFGESPAGWPSLDS
jgi:hypothetical protein